MKRRRATVAGGTGSSKACAPPASRSRRRAAALYLFPKIPASLGTDSRAAARMLLDSARVATVPGLVFGPEGEGHLRFSFSVAEDTIAGGVEALRARSRRALRRSVRLL